MGDRETHLWLAAHAGPRERERHLALADECLRWTIFACVEHDWVSASDDDEAVCPVAGCLEAREVEVIPSSHLDSLRIALQPFAAFADRLEGTWAEGEVDPEEVGTPIWRDEQEIQHGLTNEGAEISVADLRRARAVFLETRT